MPWPEGCDNVCGDCLSPAGFVSISFLFPWLRFWPVSVVIFVSHVGLIYFDFCPFNLRFIWPKLCANIFPLPGSLTRGLNVPND